MESTAFGIYNINILNSEKFYINLEQVRANYFRMPFWTDDSDLENIEITTYEYIIAIIIHNE